MNIFNNKKENESENYGQIKFLELQIKDLKSQVEGIKGIADTNQQRYGKLCKAVMNFCKVVLDRQYALAQLGDSDINLKDLDIYQLIDYTWNYILSQKTETNTLLLNMKEELDLSSKTIEDLKIQLSQLLSNRNLSKQEILEIINPIKYEEKKENECISEKKEEEKNISENPFTDEVLLETIPIIKKKKVKGNINETESSARIIEINDKDILENENKSLKNDISIKDNNISKENADAIAHVIDLKQVIKNINDIGWKAIEAIGCKGYSEKKDIIEFIKHEMTDISDATIDNVLMELKTSNAIDRERISVGWRNFYIYELTDTGISIFKEKYSGEPVLCEKRRLIKEHATAQHGYGIKDTANILKEDLHYIDVCYEQKKNRIELPNGDIYIPDVIATNPETGERQYFEYELAHHKQSDFDEKCSKMRMITNDFFFVVPTTAERAKIRRKIDSWLLSKGSPVNIKYYVTTTTNLKKGKWDCDDNIDVSYKSEKNETE